MKILDVILKHLKRNAPPAAKPELPAEPRYNPILKVLCIYSRSMPQAQVAIAHAFIDELFPQDVIELIDECFEDDDFYETLAAQPDIITIFARSEDMPGITKFYLWLRQRPDYQPVIHVYWERSAEDDGDETLVTFTNLPNTTTPQAVQRDFALKRSQRVEMN